VIDLRLTLLTTDLGSTLSSLGGFPCLTTFSIGLVKGISELNIVFVVGIITSSVGKGFAVSERILIAEKSRRL
jgi:hypothetical protein